MVNKSQIISLEYVTHDVIRLRIVKPENFEYGIAQALEIAVKSGGKIIRSIFTITSIPTDDFIEFIIKFTPFPSEFLNRLKTIKVGEEVFIHGVFGGIEYKEEGVFVAGGSGIAPFVPLLRTLKNKGELKESLLIFGNRRKKDIILEDYFTGLLDNQFIPVLSEEKNENYEQGFITADLILKSNTNNLKYYYLCGPKPMLDSIENGLLQKGIKQEFIIKESF